MKSGKSTLCVSLVSGLALSLMAYAPAANLQAQAPEPGLSQMPRSQLQRALVDRRTDTGPPTLFSALDGRYPFVLDLQASPPLLRWSDSGEIMALTVRQQGLSVRYFLDNGDLMLVKSRRGGLILYGPADAQGMAVARVGDADALAAIPLVEPEALQAVTQTMLANRATPAPNDMLRVSIANFDLLAPDAKSAHAIAGVRGVKVIENLRANLAEGALEAWFEPYEISIRQAPVPGARIQDDALLIEVSPGLGWAGVPSTFLIRDVLLAEGPRADLDVFPTDLATVPIADDQAQTGAPPPAVADEADETLFEDVIVVTGSRVPG